MTHVGVGSLWKNSTLHLFYNVLSATTAAVIITCINASNTYCVSRSRKRKRKTEYPLCVEHKMLLLMSQETLSVTLNLFCIPAHSLIKCTFSFILHVSLQVTSLLCNTWMFSLCTTRGVDMLLILKAKIFRINNQVLSSTPLLVCMQRWESVRQMWQEVIMWWIDPSVKWCHSTF